MKLNIIKYKNYGCTMVAEEKDNSDFKDKFYWSFFELNNGKTISLYNNVNYKLGKITHSDIGCHYTECYIFDEDFFDWWDKTMSNNDKDLGFPKDEEKKLIIKFYKKNIEKSKIVATQTIYLKK